MGVQPKPRMTVDEFLVWAAGRPERFELYDGEVVAMSPERVRHAEAKAAAYDALRGGIRERGLPCHVLIDGVAVRIDAETSYVPDVLVYCGERADPDATEIPSPVIVIEVLSPGTKSVDTGEKLEGYFRVPSVMHYLIVEPRRRVVIHHQRGSGDGIETRIVSAGLIDLAPPGLRFDVADVFARS